MRKIDFLHSCSIVSIMMLASVSLSGPALAQNAAGTTVNTAAPRGPVDPGRGPVDPGVRGGAPGAGGPLPGLSPLEQAFFNADCRRKLDSKDCSRRQHRPGADIGVQFG